MGEDTPNELHGPSYRWGLEIGLRTALCCRDRKQIEETLAQVQREKVRHHPSTDGEAEWQSWIVEMEMHGWERSQRERMP